MKSKHLIFWFVLAIAAVFVMAASSPQCARSTDQVTGPTLGTLNSPDACDAACRDAKKAARWAERDRHRAAIKACNGVQACKDEEDALHTMLQNEITQDYYDCLAACQHQQGGALGGQ